jgi:hypothetical protein
MPSPGVPGLDAPADVAGCLDDLAGDVDQRGPEGVGLHGEQSVSLLLVLCLPAGGDGEHQRAPRFVSSPA